ncbi:iron-sulfur cluster co-chaperone protein HscB [Latimeria chalumnae]|uniref:Iron-sulfur cluster co-chaperone protein HscB n=1 Tax=Latimeria chalumnae TaxID=7897 RepID=H2ZWA2_LATCH|nr:PREDICTED: iron-sulfur cluster co-chaperone protein HscB, mitochondrial [Latimeria chalumnae]|eukprot:XP_006001117.1 PREDICTED: iron-sulfur cluster co-chaperone protein HscB, mitochondrial [Latimeria chalumnae]
MFLFFRGTRRFVSHSAQLCGAQTGRRSSQRAAWGPGPSRKGLLAARGRLGARCASSEPPACWKCRWSGTRDGGPEPQFFCPACGALQPPDESRSYFHVLGCEKSFSVDVPKLQQNYKSLQRSLHPDHFSQKSQTERDLSEEQSALVNHAYRILLKPLSRGLYMLDLEGLALEEGTGTEMEFGFLSEVMKINENLSEAQTQAEIREIGNFVGAKLEELIEDVGEAFEQGDLKKARDCLAQMKYFSNILDKVKERQVPS